MSSADRLARLGLSHLAHDPKALREELERQLATDRLAYRGTTRARSAASTEISPTKVVPSDVSEHAGIVRASPVTSNPLQSAPNTSLREGPRRKPEEIELQPRWAMELARVRKLMAAAIVDAFLARIRTTD